MLRASWQLTASEEDYEDVYVNERKYVPETSRPNAYSGAVDNSYEGMPTYAQAQYVGDTYSESYASA